MGVTVDRISGKIVRLNTVAANLQDIRMKVSGQEDIDKAKRLQELAALPKLNTEQTKEANDLQLHKKGPVQQELKKFVIFSNPQTTIKTAVRQESSYGRSNLAALPGGEKEPERPVIKAEGDEGHFCRICRHYLHHPFTLRCGLDNHPVDPMGDCGSFAPEEE